MTLAHGQAVMQCGGGVGLGAAAGAVFAELSNSKYRPIESHLCAGMHKTQLKIVAGLDQMQQAQMQQARAMR